MKASEAPEKLYLISDEDGVMLSYDPSTKLQYGHRYDFVNDVIFPIEEGCEVEYTRTDAFIEKACEWLKDNVSKYSTVHLYSTEVNIEEDEMIEDFKKYMER